MHPLTFAQFLAASGLSVENLKAFRRRGQLALAFGRNDAYASLLYLALDCVAVQLADELANSFGRKVAAQLVRVHFDIWAEVVAVADTVKAHCFFWFVEFRRKSDNALTHLAAGTRTNDVEQIRKIMITFPEAQGYDFVRAVPVDVTSIVNRVRENAKTAGFDLSGSFLPPPSDPRYSEIFKPYKEIFERAVQKSPMDREEMARRAGIVSRALVEAGVDQ